MQPEKPSQSIFIELITTNPNLVPQCLKYIFLIVLALGTFPLLWRATSIQVKRGDTTLEIVQKIQESANSSAYAGRVLNQKLLELQIAKEELARSPIGNTESAQKIIEATESLAPTAIEVQAQVAQTNAIADTLEVEK
jgi:hypothetical protein